MEEGGKLPWGGKQCFVFCAVLSRKFIVLQLFQRNIVSTRESIIDFWSKIHLETSFYPTPSFIMIQTLSWLRSSSVVNDL